MMQRLQGVDAFYQPARGGELLQDVESALGGESDSEQNESCSGDSAASIVEAKVAAREKFDWLTSHAVVARSRTRSGDAFMVPALPSACTNPDDEGCEDAGLRLRAASETCATPMTGTKMSRPGSYKSAAQYLSACGRYSLTPNGGALLGLSLGLEMLEVDGTLTNLELVPLCAALLEAPFVQHLKLSGHPLQDTGAAVLALALPGCPWIQELELVGCRITGAGVRSICDALPKSGVSRLVLRGNLLQQNAASANNALAAVVAKAGCLVSLDLQSCGLSSRGMRLVKQSLGDRGAKGYPTCTVQFEGNFVLVEVLNSLTHGVCALLCLEGWRRLNNLIDGLCHFESRVSLTLYIVSMLLMFTGSTLYHSTFAMTDLSWFFMMIDHCAIYFLIAGTYTPVVVMGCRDPDTMEMESGVSVAVSIYWALVAFGIMMEHVFAAQKPSWYSKFILGMYVLLGFGGVPYIARCSLINGGNVMSWIELGGLTYVVGIVFFLLDRRYPAMHVVWHLLVGLAAFFHFVGVWNLTALVLSDPHRRCTGESVWGTAVASVFGWEPLGAPVRGMNATAAAPYLGALPPSPPHGP